MQVLSLFSHMQVPLAVMGYTFKIWAAGLSQTRIKDHVVQWLLKDASANDAIGFERSLCTEVLFRGTKTLAILFALQLP